MAEAEFGGIVNSGQPREGIQSMPRDVSIELGLERRADADTAIAIRRRRCSRKIRHFTWRMCGCMASLKKIDNVALTTIPSQEPAADALTKHVDLRTLDKHLAAMSLQLKDGRAGTGPALQKGATTHGPMNA